MFTITTLQTLDRPLAAVGGVVIDDPACAKAIQEGKADFSDYLIGEKNLANGCDRTIAFDKGLRGEGGFEVLPLQLIST